jgi:hypothetical protein
MSFMCTLQLGGGWKEKWRVRGREEDKRNKITTVNKEDRLRRSPLSPHELPISII